MKISRLHYITNGNSESEILEEVKAALNGGVDWIQLRIKNENLDVLEIGKKVKTLCANKATFILNDRVEIANELDADGVHLGLSDMPIPKAREILGDQKIIGGTANTHQDCINRINDGANYIGLGPFKHTTTKKKLSPIVGLNGYQTILNDEVTIPVLAIGGIELKDVELIIGATNIYGIAVSSLIKNALNKGQLVSEIYKGFGIIGKVLQRG